MKTAIHGFDSRPRLELDWRIQAAFIQAQQNARLPVPIVVGRLIAKYFSNVRAPHRKAAA